MTYAKQQLLSDVAGLCEAGLGLPRSQTPATKPVVRQPGSQTPATKMRHPHEFRESKHYRRFDVTRNSRRARSDAKVSRNHIEMSCPVDFVSGPVDFRAHSVDF